MVPYNRLSGQVTILSYCYRSQATVRGLRLAACSIQAGLIYLIERSSRRFSHAVYVYRSRLSAASLVDPTHDRLDLRLLDRQVADAVARRDVGDQGSGGRRLAVEAQPDARSLTPHRLRVRQLYG